MEAPETLFPYQSVNLRFGPPENFAWDDWLADDEEMFFFIGDPDSNDTLHPPEEVIGSKRG